MRVAVALVCGQAKVVQRAFVVGNAALALREHEPEVVLGWGVALFGGKLVPLARQGRVVFVAGRVGQQEAEVELGVGVALGSG